MKRWEALPLRAGQSALLRRARVSQLAGQMARRRYPSAPPPDGRSVRVAVVQLGAQLFRSADTYAEHMGQLACAAVQLGAQLVIFPEDTGSYPLAGLIPGIARLAAGSLPSAAGAEAPARRGADPMLWLLRLLAPAAATVHGAVFSALARGLQAHLLAGSTLELDGAGRVYKVAHLYGPSGERLLVQRKTHLFPLEAQWGLTPGDDMAVADTPLGRIAAPICMDHTYFEPVRSAWLQGAEIIVDPAADAARYHPWLQARGVWGRVQESPAYGIHALMVGTLLGIGFGGRSGVYAPLALTPAGDGVLAQAETGECEELVLADLDLPRLRAYRQDHPLRPNTALYARYLPALYRQLAWGRPAP